jgi:hypothetical protein
MTSDLVDHALDVLAAPLAVDAASAQVALVEAAKQDGVGEAYPGQRVEQLRRRGTGEP